MRFVSLRNSPGSRIVQSCKAQSLRSGATPAQLKKGNIMRNLKIEELESVAGGANPHLTTISITTNPGGVVNKSIDNNPNAETTTITYKTTGKPNR